MTTAVRERQSIRTLYKDVLFRSKLEADFARAFDALGIEWRYEQYGQYFGDLFYLVDFFLPQSRQYVEVKGVFEPSDVRKIAALLAHVPARPHTLDGDTCPDIALVACEPGGVFRGWQRGACPADASLLELSRTACHGIALFRCVTCRGWWFADADLSWRCQCCGAYDGRRLVSECLDSPLPGFPELYDLRPIGRNA